jgi:hypothetical protein
MPVSHRRVAQPPYLRRKPPHVAGQLLQLVHCGNHSFEGPLHTASKRGRPGRYSTNGINIGDFPVSGALTFRPLTLHVATQAG